MVPDRREGDTGGLTPVQTGISCLSFFSHSHVACLVPGTVCLFCLCLSQPCSLVVCMFVKARVVGKRGRVVVVELKKERCHVDTGSNNKRVVFHPHASQEARQRVVNKAGTRNLPEECTNAQGKKSHHVGNRAVCKSHVTMPVGFAHTMSSSLLGSATQGRAEVREGGRRKNRGMGKKEPNPKTSLEVG